MSFVTSSKNLVQKQLRRFGWEIKRVNSGDIADLVRTLNDQQITKVFDVGANLGQYASSVFATGFNGEVVSFEPLSEIHASITQSAQSNPKWRVHDRCAVGASAGTVTINRAANAVSSSVLAIEETHVSAAPNSRFVGQEEVPVIALDDLNEPNLDSSFLKIDTQGFESEVLKGASNMLKTIRGAQLEISIAPLYEGQADYAALFDVMHEAGLRLWSVEPGFRDPKSRRLLQFDAIFMR